MGITNPAVTNKANAIEFKIPVEVILLICSSLLVFQRPRKLWMRIGILLETHEED